MRIEADRSFASMANLRQPADDFFTKQADAWSFRYSSRTYQQRRDLVLNMVRGELSTLRKKPAEIEALDFGCGAGVLLKDVSELGIRVTGVDRSQAMIEAAKSRLGASPLAPVEWLENDSGRGAFQQRSYDIILCLSVLEFVSNPQQIIARLAAVLKSGGVLILTVPNRNSWLRRLERFLFQHPNLVSWLSPARRFIPPDSYLKHQVWQFTASEIIAITQPLHLTIESFHFHVAPRVMGRTERLEKVGMMLLAAIRKQ